MSEAENHIKTTTTSQQERRKVLLKEFFLYFCATGDNLNLRFSQIKNGILASCRNLKDPCGRDENRKWHRQVIINLFREQFQMNGFDQERGNILNKSGSK